MSQYVAVVPRGLEPVLVDELAALGILTSHTERGAVRFEADLEQAYGVLMWSRVASRVLHPLATFEESSFEALDACVASIPWLEHVRADGTLAVDVVAASGIDVHTRYAAQRTKDVICDGIRHARGVRPSVDTESPDIRVHVHLGHETSTLAIDLAGGSLHRRGYRIRGALAPVKENLAAGIVSLSGFARRVPEGLGLVDPMCGSGTLLAEAALIAADVAPGLLRVDHPVARWLGHDAGMFARVRREADERSRAGRAALRATFVGYDASEVALESTSRAFRDLGLGRHLRVERRAIEDAHAPAGEAPGTLIVNPPYGERLGAESELAMVYEALGDTMRRRFPGYDAWVLTGSPVLAKRIGLKATAKIQLWNGPIECRLLHFPISTEIPTSVPAFRRIHEEAQAFDNRLRKNEKLVGKRAAREGLEVFRVYDADIPEYNVAVDRYADHVVVQEYAAPWSIDPDIAARRLRDVLAVVGDVLEVPRSRLHLAVRKRQQSGAQYERRDDEGTAIIVREGECVFEVRFDERLDTGLFPDHRLLRAQIGAAAKDGDLLNLFAYTCTASVVAAKAGARSTTSVDLSQTYLAWGERNFGLNHLGLRHNELVRADCMRFLDEDTSTFDVVFANPPSYSRSHRMNEDFSVIRDQVRLLEGVMRRTRRTGFAFFSTHARGFSLDASLRDRFIVEDLSPRSVPFDFKRSPHQAFSLRHR